MLGPDLNKIDSFKATVLISTYKRPECLRLQILAWIGCSAVAQIRVNWFQSVTPPGLAALLGDEFALQVPQGKVVFDELPNKISHRFLPREFPTAAIFHSDDDVFYSCSLLESALTIWRGAGTSAVVGFNGRLIPTWGHSGAIPKNTTDLSQGADEIWDATLYWPWPRSSVFVTKGAITSVGPMRAFFSERYSRLREKADALLTGEDLLMSFVIATEYGRDHRTHLLCAGRGDACHSRCSVDVTTTKVPSLTHRSAGGRKHFLGLLLNSLGNPFANRTGHADDLHWSSPTSRVSTSTDNSRLLLDARAPQQHPDAQRCCGYTFEADTCETFCCTQPVCPGHGAQVNNRTGHSGNRHNRKAACTSAANLQRDADAHGGYVTNKCNHRTAYSHRCTKKVRCFDF